MFPVGIDVSKDTFDLCMLYDGIKGRIRTKKIKNDRSAATKIIRLANEVLLHREGRGWMTTPVEPEEIRQLFDYREALEVSALRMAEGIFYGSTTAVTYRFFRN